MTLLTILEYPDPRLKTKAKPVTEFTPDLKKLADDMAQTMYKAPGIGLAATQVDRHIRMVVIDVTEDRSDLRTFVNPIIIAKEGKAKGEEGCLSVPGIYDDVERAEKVTVRAQDVHGKTFELEADGLLSVCIQHELDHLEGKVFVEYLSSLKQTRVKSKLLKAKREREKQSA
jgi:peptide deformylase